MSRDITEEAVWRGVKKGSHKRLTASLDVEVAIIGGGMTGMLAAYLLKDTGKSVALLEKDFIGNAATGHTTAFLVETIDTDITELIPLIGQMKTREVLASHRSAVDLYESIIKTENIICEFTRCPLYIYGSTREDAIFLKKEARYGSRLGSRMSYSTAPLPMPSHGHIRVEHQAKFHPLKFLYAITDIVTASGVHIYENTEVRSLTKHDGYMRLSTQSGEVTARRVLVATHHPAIGDDQPARLFFKKGRYITYVYELRLKQGVLSEGLYEDTKNPYHYMRVDRIGSSDRMLAGGEDHRADIPISEEKNFKALQTYIEAVLPKDSYEFKRRWKGPIIEPSDGLAYIGTLKNKSVFYATGFSGNGMTYAAITAQMFRDHVLEEQNEWTNLYAPLRSPSLKQYLRKTVDYFMELLFGALKNSKLNE